MGKVKYDIIGKGYNNTRKADPFIAGRLSDLLRAECNQKYLDIGCGTGNYTYAFKINGIQIFGMDPSSLMLNTASQLYPDIEFTKGSASHTALRSNSIDGIIAVLTIHHWESLPDSFKELDRILVSGGTIGIFTSSPEQMKGYWLNEYFPNLMQNSISQMPSVDHISNSLLHTSLHISQIEKYNIRDDLQDLFLYCGKNNPDIYFNPQVRNGISSFSSLANKYEVEKGLSRLRSDLQGNRFAVVAEKYGNDKGDYLFIIINKYPLQ